MPDEPARHALMEQRRLGRTGLSVSVLGLGAAPLGGMYAPTSDAAAAETVCTALDAGITLIDVAPHYEQGLAERRLGLGLAQRPSGGYAVSTKVGRLLAPSPEPSTSPIEALARQDAEFRFGHIVLGCVMPFEPLAACHLLGQAAPLEADELAELLGRA